MLGRLGKKEETMPTMGWKRAGRSIVGLVTSVLAILVLAGAAEAATPAEFAFVPESLEFSQSGPHAGVNGGHPDLTIAFSMDTDPTKGTGRAAQAPRKTVVELPEGLVGDPQAATATCALEDVTATQHSVSPLPGKCPRESAVGEVKLDSTYPNGNAFPPQLRRLYRVAAGPDEVVAFATTFATLPLRIAVKVSPSGDYRVVSTADKLPQSVILRGFEVKMWGVPADHQGFGPNCEGYLFNNVLACLDFQPPDSQAPGSNPLIRFGEPLEGAKRRAFLTNSSVCGAALKLRLRLEPYGTIFKPIEAEPSAGTLSGCETQPFGPSLDVTPKSRVAGQPSGYTVGINVPQEMNPDKVATAHVKDVEVTLPRGVAISPPSANGLDACTDDQLDLNGDSDPEAASGCPDASKIGSLRIETPVLEEPVRGHAYLGAQLSDDPASGEMYRLFLVAKARGVLIKLKGAVKVDAKTGQITSTFENNPQLPFSRMELALDHGARASLRNPEVCGDHISSARFTSWSGKMVESKSTFTIDDGCPTGQFKPSMQAGVADPSAGESSPFALVLNRQDGERVLKTIRSIELPEGLLAKVATVTLCGDIQADSGTCAESSRIGHVQIAAGTGPQPLWVPQPGNHPTGVYLTGPYKGAPYGLSIKVPAQAGPFNLGTVVVRSALHVNERTAQLATGIDESRVFGVSGGLEQVIEGAMPTILKGIPLNLREVRVIADREDFIINPTNCTQQQIAAQVVAVDNGTADLTKRFRAADCASLGFAPRFRAQILNKGRKSTLRSFHPRTRFTVVPRRGDANIGAARVVLPSSTILDQANIGTTCTRAQMAERKCPEASIVGHARAWSPLLNRPVQGPVYLAANGGVRPLPDLAAVMDGEIRIVLQGEITTRRGGGKARLQNTFRVVPDAPVSRFVLTMRGGAKRGLLVNSTDLCRTGERGAAVFHGQNGRRSATRLRVATAFRGCAKVRRQAARRKAGRQ